MSYSSEQHTHHLNHLHETIKDNERSDPRGHIHGLGTTIEGELPSRPPSSNETEPVIPGEFILNKINFDSENQSRYRTGQLLGSGGGGAVYDLIDSNLNRTIAAKFLPKSLSDDKDKVTAFMHEALVTSRLDHPNIPPIYDLEALSDNQIFYTMKKIDGNPLSQYVEADISETLKPEQLNNLITIFIKTCEAIAYAHSRQIIHRDIKPANIMLGKFGEVRIVDWGIAIEANNPDLQNSRLSGTPIYMSPEQANRTPVDERSDIYAIGASLFHILLKRPPTYSDDIDSFWELKKAGEIQKPSTIEAQHIPGPLLAICLKCLAPKADERYPNAESLVNDFIQFQSGGSIWAYNYNLFEIIKKWARDNTGHIKWMTLVLLIICAATTFIFTQYQRQYAGWGDPIHTEPLNNSESWENNWTITAGSVKVADNALITNNGLAFCAFYNKPIQGGACIEFTGEMLAGSNPGDISIVFTPDLHNTTTYSKMPKTLYYLQSGAHGNQCAAIAGPHGRLDYHRQTLETGKKYNIRGEIDGKKLRLYINGTLTCSYDLLLPLTSGYIGLYGFYGDKSFSNINIYTKSIPELTNAIKTGDLLFENNLYQLAADRYLKIKSIHDGTPLGDESNYKLGLCYYKLKQPEKAFSIWAQQKNNSFKKQISFHYWNNLFINKQYNTLTQEMTALYASVETETQRQIQSEWATFLKLATNSNDLTLVKSLLTFRNDNFPDDQVFSHQVLGALRILGDCQQALILYPDQDVIIIQALRYMGRFNDIITNYPQHRYSVSQALLESGEYKKIIADYSDMHESYFYALIAVKDYKRAEAIAYQGAERATVLFSQGKIEEVIKRFPNKAWGEHLTHLTLGNFDKYLETPNISRSNKLEALIGKNLIKYFNNNPDALPAIKELTRNVNASEKQQIGIIFNTYFVDAVLDHFAGNPQTLKDRCATIWTEKKQMLGMRLWHCAGLLSGEMTEEEFLLQPMQHNIQRDHLLYKALHEDLYGNKTTAKAYYNKLISLQISTPSSRILIDQRLKKLSIVH